jgi:hypothetical protein
LELNRESSSVMPEDSLHDKDIPDGGEPLNADPSLLKKTGTLLSLNLIEKLVATSFSVTSIEIAGSDAVGCTTKLPIRDALAFFSPKDSAFAVFAVLETNLNWSPSTVPSAVAINWYPGAVPTCMLPLVFILGVIEVIVLNRPNVETVLPSVGPLIVSVLSKPSVSVPTIVKVLSLSLAVDVIDTLVPKYETKEGIVQT